MPIDTPRVSQIASAAASTTATGNPIPGIRGAAVVQLTCWTTGTSAVSATVILQGSNDNNAWIAIGSATGTVGSTATGTGRQYNGAAIPSTAAYAYLRAATLAVVGTGNAVVNLAS